ncbi:hypothetical protein C0J52_12502 [Blattella germanica]|nr:hypothetical protein C0J52_12502 [Blattella germanica]
MEDNSVSSPLPDSDKEAKCHPRLTQYKTSSKSNTLNQEERRWQLLQDQKRKRDECFNASRGLIEQLESLSQEQDQMEYTNIKIKPKLVEFYRNRLMLSEWLEHVPEDLADNWFIVPCPIGRRSLVVACGGLTRTFSKGGIHITTFKSALPGGNSEDPKRSTLIDCIWSSTNHTYYVLDVLVWGSHPLLDCEVEEINIVDSSREMEISGLDDTETDSKESSIEEMQLNCCSENCVEEMEPLDCN